MPDQQVQNQVSAVGIPQTVEVQKLLQAAERAKGTGRRNILQRLNRDVLYLVVILLLSLLLLVMSGFVVASLTSMNVNVTFTSGSSAATSDAGDSSSTVPTDMSTGNSDDIAEDPVDSELIAVTYLLLDREVNPALTDDDVMDTAVRIELGSGDNFWVPVPFISSETVSTGELLEQVLNATLTQREVIYQGLLLTNPLLLPIEFEVVRQGGDYQVNIVGEINFADTEAEDYFKSQIETIVRYYTNSYFLTLNGDERAYEQLGA